MVNHKSEEFIYDSDSGDDIEDHAFQAPKGFSKVPMAAPSTSAKDKEIWLIKTPKNFPIHKLKLLPVSFTAKKINSKNAPKPVEVNGEKYQVNEDVFVSDNAKYALLNESLQKRQIDRYYTLRQVIDIPGIDFDKVFQPREDVPQIEGLKMRHFATGYGAHDFEEAQPIAEPRLDENGKLLKRGREEDEKPEEKPEKKQKKEKKHKKDKKEKKEKKEKKH